MKKLISIVLTVILAVAVFTSCSPSTPDAPVESAAADSAVEPGSEAPASGPEESGDATTITVWSWDPAFNISIMNQAAAYYTADHPEVHIDVVEMAKEDVEQKLHTTLAAQTSEGLPDIVLIEDYNAQKYLASYPGSFADLTDTFNYANFAAYKNEILERDSRMYAVPFDSGVAGFFYRSDILGDAGYSAEDLNNITWDRYIEIGRDVLDKTGAYMLGFEKVDGGFMRMMMQSAGEWYFDENGNSKIAESAVVAEAMETYKKIVDSGIAKPTNGWDEWVSSINTGEAATITSGVWIVGSIKEGADQSGNWSVAPVPRLNSGTSVNATNLGGSSWYVLENAAGRDAAIAFMQEIYGAHEQFYQDILINNGAIGSYLPAFSGDAYSTPDAFFGGEAIYADLSTWATQIPEVNYGSYTYEADAAIMAQMDAYCNGSMTLEDALSAAEAQLINQIQ